MAEADLDKYAKKTQQKFYDNHAFDECKTAGDPSRFFVTSKTSMSFRKSDDTASDYSTVQYRYIVTLFGFFVYYELDSFRIATSMSVVKMVNTTAVNIAKHMNITLDSCPVNNSAIEILLPENLEGEFDWSPEIQSYILSAGFLGYVISQIPAGMFAEIYGAKKVLVSGVFISSMAHLLCPFATWWNCYVLITVQFVRGLGQGFLPPANSIITAKWFPKYERGFLNSLTFAGYGVGSLITYSTSGVLCSSTLFGGWPLLYFVYGGLGMLFCLCICLFLYDSPKEHPHIGKAELIYILENQESDLSQKQPKTPWRKIITSVPVYMMTYSIFSHFWIITQQLSSHPIFLANILHFPIEKNGILNAIPFAFQILLIFIGGWVSKWLNVHGYVGVDKLRKGCTIIYCIGYSLSLVGTYFAGCDRIWSNVCSIIAFSFVGISVLGCVIVPCDMSPTFAGSIFAFSNTIASSATFILPLIVGAMIDIEESMDQWNKIFLLCVIVVMSSGILFCVFGSAEIQSWNYPTTENNERKQVKEDAVKSENKETVQSKNISLHL